MNKATISNIVYGKQNLDIVLDRHFKLNYGNYKELIDSIIIENIRLEIGNYKGNSVDVLDLFDLRKIVKLTDKQEKLKISKLDFLIKFKSSKLYKKCTLFINEIHLHDGLNFNDVEPLLILNGFCEAKGELC